MAAAGEEILPELIVTEATVAVAEREPNSLFWPALCRILYTASLDLVGPAVDPEAMAAAEETLGQAPLTKESLELLEETVQSLVMRRILPQPVS